ncbi:hypothetical protein EG68_04179 [Paragonimus skrjabini miyazakii]|uniref:RAD51 interacting motif domain-containing protein n=1 Tax=Paragonimus skrjabini miyazakii TaxID=59628 RepID=A0A8S9YV56_9TREM|nr:hypothetical protein EG68_04179 [Paragonimus skrjabini miyazakii]
MSERRSVRPRKTLDYAKLEDDSDEEFFAETPSNPKKKKDKDKDDWLVPVDDESFDKTQARKTDKIKSKEKKPPKESKQAQKTTTVSPGALKSANSVASSETVEQLEMTKSHQFPTTPKTSIPSCVGNFSRTGLSSTSTASPQPSERLHFAVTPTSGLRLGLSRNQKLRSLHTNIRIS